MSFRVTAAWEAVGWHDVTEPVKDKPSNHPLETRYHDLADLAARTEVPLS